ncbi:hypothetical protein [Bacillus paramycoides]|uniref:Lipoprotein n=1 Tax=Bacillus paramycoides TaxID=2026194 RepID=A0ABU6MSN9_9BACI|nr:hypothetical protein [Bacillus paramycoides]
MKKNIVICMISALTLAFVGCSNSSDKTTETKSTTVTTSAKVVKCKNKDIETIELANKKTNKTKKFSKADIQTIVNGLETAKEKSNLSLNSEAKNNMNAVMKIIYKDGTKQEFFVWLEGNGEQVMFTENTTDNHTTGYEANGTPAKDIIDLFSK